MKKNIILSFLICIVALVLVIVVIANITGDNNVNMSFKWSFMQAVWNLLKMFW